MPPIESFNPDLIQAFIQLIVRHTGISIRENDQKAFKETIAQRAKLTGLNSIEAYYQLLTDKTYQSHQEWEVLNTEITNTESFFFRDKGQFKLLKNHIFPELISRKADTRKIRICSAGCSTGEEPYSVAMMLYESFPEIKGWELTILGVDINSTALEKARKGIYRPWSFRGVDPTIQTRFFEQINNHYHINQNVRNMVSFKAGNLLDNSALNPFSYIRDIDLILCRNVFIYFSNSAVKAALDKFYNALSPLGYLVVGHAELYSQNPSNFQAKMFEESIAYQRPEDSSIAPITQTPLVPPQNNSYPTTMSDADDLQALDDSLTGVNIQMQQAAINMLRHLPADTRIARLGNLTVSELIQQYEQASKEID